MAVTIKTTTFVLILKDFGGSELEVKTKTH